MDQAARNGDLLRADLRRNHGEVILELEGQLDLSTAPLVDVEISRLGGFGFRIVVLDLQGLEFLDCAGARPLVRLSVEVAAHGGRLVVAGASRLVTQVLGAAGLPESVTR